MFHHELTHAVADFGKRYHSRLKVIAWQIALPLTAGPTEVLLKVTGSEEPERSLRVTTVN